MSGFQCFVNSLIVNNDLFQHQVNAKFEEFFTTMGYAGHIQLDRGKFENDFAHYGIEVLVKFRENMPLQKLDPFRQSGISTRAFLCMTLKRPFSNCSFLAKVERKDPVLSEIKS